MPNTGYAELPYPLSSGTVQVHTDIQNLAVAADLIAQMLGNEDVFSGVGTCSVATTSASYVDITSASKSFTKIGSAAQSDIIVEVGVGGFVTVASTAFKVGVNINGVDRDATSMLFNGANAHGALPLGTARFTGLAAGVYTVKLRALRPSGTGTCTIDSNDTVSMSIRERPI